ncbi:hypothetical protein J2755_001951 [Methanohalophilus levihalophilus]|uniref:DUF7507 domain-containing protein n=1 Tax=Methanohalophilus levihalophilus TaxID=1431282 RepID=UPI001AE45008|nr:hypothetical protein [Methanohalophilus levihalophilus]MBP2031003.1 hypothetical protein [Methanohalophilus levihalophilus]
MRTVVIYIGILALIALLFAGLVSVSDDPADIGTISGNDSFDPGQIFGPQEWNTSTNDRFTIRVSEGDKKKTVEVASIDIEKHTNSHDADVAPGPYIFVEPEVTIINWTYYVTNTGDFDLTNISVTDNRTTINPGPISGDDNDGILEPGETWVYNATDYAMYGQYANLATVTATYKDDIVSDEDPSHYYGGYEPETYPSIEIEKLTIGQDADNAPGPIIPVGSPVVWEYVVTNTGNVPLADINVVDDLEGTIGTISYLSPGSSHTLNASGIAVEGQYSNLATANTTYDEVLVSDSDPSNYFGDVEDEAEPAIDIEKTTVGQDADVVPGPAIPVGSPFIWEYTVTNIGNVPLFNVNVTDDKEGFIGTISYLSVGESHTFNASGNAIEGQYSNLGNVTARYADETVSDEDPSNYYGETDPDADPSVNITKLTVGIDADNAPGPSIPVGTTVTWEYNVTNTGNVPLFNVNVTDDKEGFIGVIPYLGVDDFVTLNTTGVSEAGQYSNIGNVTAEYGNTIVSDEDPGHYLGETDPDADPSVNIEKHTNGYDADAGSGPTIPVGSWVVWEYTITNTGNVVLFDVQVNDDKEGFVGNLPFLAPGQSKTLYEYDIVSKEGQYSNLGNVSARYGSAIVNDSDPSHYLGGPRPDVDPSVSIEKTTNGYDADRGTGPRIQIGSDVVWEYTVTNTGDVTLFNIRVSDDEEGYIGTIRHLYPGQSRTLDKIGEAEEGRYSNEGTAYTYYRGSRVSDSDQSHYIGVDLDADPALHIEKTTNGYDADRGTGPKIQVGSDVVWEYTVTNTGDVTLRGIRVRDSDEGYIGYISYLHPGQSRTLDKIGEAEEGQYSNVGRAYARYYRGYVGDTDPSHYYGTEVDSNPSLHLEKTTNGYDADRGTGPKIQVGSDVVWEYTVTNTGDVTLRGIRVRDSDEGYIGYISYLHPGQSRTLDKIGEAEEGQYSNVGRAYARYYRGYVGDTDPSHYLGVERDANPSIHIEKTTNGYDADTGTGPKIQVGSDVVWEYKVTNTGDVMLRYIRVYDSRERYIGTIRYLYPGQSRTLDKIGEAEEGQYSNVGRAYARYYRGYVGDTDPSHYLGVERDANPSIHIEKTTNGYDADTGTGPKIQVGSDVVWEYKVTNTGDVMLRYIRVYDSRERYIGTIRYLYPGQSRTLDKIGEAEEGQYSNVGRAYARYYRGYVGDTDPSHYYGTEEPNADPSIVIEKYTNGQDADVAPGPTISVGSNVVWEYKVKNTGNVTLFAVEVGDNEEGYIGTIRYLHPGQSKTLQKRSVSEAGQYSNTGYVSGIYDSSPILGPLRVLDNDPSHYFGGPNPDMDPSIRIEKTTNGFDADTGAGPVVPVGSLVVWEYNVTNTGNVTLFAVEVGDDQEGYVDTIPFLHPGQSQTVDKSGTSEEGQYSNTGYVSGIYDSSSILGPLRVLDNDPSHYLGSTNPVPNPAIKIEKTTNDIDADTGTGPSIPVGFPVVWKYNVTNTGNVALINIQVTDDKEGYIGSIPFLHAGQSYIFNETNVSVEGQYSNLGNVSAMYGSATLKDSDSSHYLGVAEYASLRLEKYTNGYDADLDDITFAPSIPVGNAVTWNYTVYNEGNIPLTDIIVTDDKEGYIGTIAELGVGESNNSLSAQNVSVKGWYSNLATANTTYDGQPVNDTDPSHYFGYYERASVDIEKYTNGYDADYSGDPTMVPFIPVGDDVYWNYTVRNTGNTVLYNIEVVDDKEGYIGTIAELGLGESNTSLFARNVSVLGEYENNATVTAEPEFGPNVTDYDLSHYFGYYERASVDIEKYTNGYDADYSGDPTMVPFIPVGDDVYWNYTVRNTGNTVLYNIEVVDDKEGYIGTIAELGLGESNTSLFARNVSVLGEYENNATVTAEPEFGPNVTDYDLSHYFGYYERASVDIEKYTNGYDADYSGDPTMVPFIPVGDDVYWNYTVRNTGNTVLYNIEVVDDKEGYIGTIAELGLGESNTSLFARNVSVLGEYENNATVTAEPEFGPNVTDYDLSHYLGYAASASIDLEVLTNGQDVNDPAFAPLVPVGNNVTWNYTVTNTGNAVLYNIVVNDSQEGYIGTIAELGIGETNSSLFARNVSVLGLYSNVATARTTHNSQPVVDTDSSYYFGHTKDASLDIEKRTNGLKVVNPAFAPDILVGSTVIWNYTVTNTGGAVLYDVIVTDDKEGYIGTIEELGIGKSNSSLSAQNISVKGLYSNTVTAETSHDSQPISDSDSSYYYGIDGNDPRPLVDLEKFTNNNDADAAPGPSIMIGTQVTWKYVVTNAGNVNLTNVVVTDNKVSVNSNPVAGDDGDNVLEPGESWVYEASGLAIAGPYENLGNVTASYEDTVVSDEDLSHYTGVNEEIPEFPTVAIPMLVVISLLFVFRRRQD